MKNSRKYVSLILCFCVSIYTMPVFAYAQHIQSVTNNISEEIMKVELTDEQLTNAVGANGEVDATMATYKVGSQAEAVVSNLSNLPINYSLDVIDINGGVVENLTSGVLQPDTAELIKGTPSDANSRYVRVRVWHSSLAGLSASDSSWSQ